MLWKYRHLMLLSGRFLDKVTPGIGFTDEAVVQCDGPVVKIRYVPYGPYVLPFLDPVLCIVLQLLNNLRHIILGADYMKKN